MDGHVHAFAFFGRVPQSALYDNDRCLISKILQDGTRKRATLFSALQSHYLFLPGNPVPQAPERHASRSHKETIGDRLQCDLAAMKPLPGAPFEACDQANGKVNSQSLVRYDTNDYSVPVAYALPGS